MNRIFKVFLVALAVLVAPVAAFAVPLLQLDIEGGTYDYISESVVTASGDFTLYAILSPGGDLYDDEGNVIGPFDGSLEELLAETFYISAAVYGDFAAGGSFTMTNGRTGDTASPSVTDGLVYGLPPVEANILHDGGDLPGHGIFPAWYYEFGFQFTDDMDYWTETYNTQDDPGGVHIPWTDPETGSLYIPFEVSTGGYQLHFDLYNTKVSKKDPDDIDRDLFAPFSHDAETRVPEPGTLLLLGTGLLGLGLVRRGRKA